MEGKPRIGAGQFFISMFVARTAVTVGLNARYMGGENLLDNVVSAFLAMGLGVVISLPVWFYHGRCPDKGVQEGGKVISLLYVLYFLLTGAASLTLFYVFLLDTVNPDLSTPLVIAAILGVALYGAIRGLETCARYGTCVLAVLLLGCLLVFGAAAVRFRGENLEPLFYNGFSQTVTGTALLLSRTSLFADMAILLPMVRGRKKAGFSLWAAGTALFLSLLLLLLAGCLGRYAYTQNFPVYALAAITEIRSLQRLDAVFIGVWMMGLVVKLAFELYACRVCFSALGLGKKTKAPTAALSALMLGLALLSASLTGLRQTLLDTRLQLCGVLLTGCILPLGALAVNCIKNRRKGKTGS